MFEYQKALMKAMKGGEMEIKIKRRTGKAVMDKVTEVLIENQNLKNEVQELKEEIHRLHKEKLHLMASRPGSIIKKWSDTEMTALYDTVGRKFDKMMIDALTKAENNEVS